MNITRELVEQRKAALLVDYNAIAGALQDCDYWLSVLDQEEGQDATQEEDAGDGASGVDGSELPHPLLEVL